MDMTTKLDIAREIITVASLLIKFDAEDIIFGKDEVFVAFINELGIKNEAGKEFNVASYKKLMRETLNPESRSLLIGEFNEGFSDIYKMMEMYSNR